MAQSKNNKAEVKKSADNKASASPNKSSGSGPTRKNNTLANASSRSPNRGKKENASPKKVGKNKEEKSAKKQLD